MNALIAFFVLIAAFVGIPGCVVAVSYNATARADLAVIDANTRLLSVYRKRADLGPNLVSTVQGSAGHEAGALKDVTSARASATQVKLPENADQETMNRWVAAQKELSAGLGRLLAVAESYPTITATASFIQLQRQLQDIEAQASAARILYIKSVNYYNSGLATLPSNQVAAWFGFTKKPQLEFDEPNTLKKSPRVNFPRS